MSAFLQFNDLLRTRRLQPSLQQPRLHLPRLDWRLPLRLGPKLFSWSGHLKRLVPQLFQIFVHRCDCCRFKVVTFKLIST
jgi:hypothetical protein